MVKKPCEKQGKFDLGKTSNLSANVDFNTTTMWPQHDCERGHWAQWARWAHAPNGLNVPSGLHKTWPLPNPFFPYFLLGF